MVSNIIYLLRTVWCSKRQTPPNTGDLNAALI